MATQKLETSIKPERSGVLPGVVLLALDVADRGQTTAISVLQDARTELRTAVDNSVDFAEKLTAALFRLARKSVARLDEAGADALSGLHHVVANTLNSARETTRAAAELATTASNGVAGHHAAA
ncbi:MAG: hypothetical protein ACTHU0_33655 [Kofleriaceae bacterium]